MGWGDTLTASVLCVLAIALESTAGAATIPVHDADSHGRVFVDLVGKIEDGDALPSRAYFVRASYPQRRGCSLGMGHKFSHSFNRGRRCDKSRSF